MPNPFLPSRKDNPLRITPVIAIAIIIQPILYKIKGPALNISSNIEKLIIMRKNIIRLKMNEARI